jgi:hypothetical protein
VPIYHLHIPRTSGLYIKNFVVPQLHSKSIQHFCSNRSEINLGFIRGCKYISGHFGVMPISEIPNLSVFTLLRDPVERFISYFNSTTKVDMPKKDVMDKLNNWLYEEDTQHNLQSKFLTGSTNILKFHEGYKESKNASVDHGWWIEDFSLNINDIKKSLDKMNAYTMEDFDLFKKDFNESLYKEFKFKIFQNNYKVNSSTKNIMPITNDIIDRIKEVNSIDQQVYDYVNTINRTVKDV